jgi:methionyl-tRNA formyltransferase
MNIIYMGTPRFACPPLSALANSRHSIRAVVTGRDKPSGRGRTVRPGPVKQLAGTLGLPTLQPARLKDQAFLNSIEAYAPDLIVVVAFRILPQKLLDIPSKGAINIHGSLLPRYRGAAPITHALLNGDTETGLTSFYLTRKIDGGDIIARKNVAIAPDESYSTLYDRLSELAGPFLLESLDLIEKPDFSPQSQDDSEATPAPKISSEDGLIDWTKDDRTVHNQIRAYADTPGAYSFLQEKKIKILGSHRIESNTIPALPPGTIHVERRHLYAGTGNLPLELIRLQPEGKKIMDAASFLNGYRVKDGNKFSSVRKEVS